MDYGIDFFAPFTMILREGISEPTGAMPAETL